MVLEKIRNRANLAVCEIERRDKNAPMFYDNVEIYKECKYINDRSLEDYYNCLPYLKRYLTNNINVLDIGCGMGNALREIKEKFNCDVVGTSLDDSINKDFLIVNSTASMLPFADNSFDVVISVHGISWEPDQRTALNEVVRVLKPGGTAHIYLIKFSHSIALFVGKKFWEGIDKAAYEEYEFVPDINIVGANVYVKELEFLEEKCEEYYKEWHILIIKEDY